MDSIVVSDLAYAHPGGDILFSDVSFKVGPGEHAALIGVNGIGKSTLMRILAGEHEPLEGECAVPDGTRYMPQSIGFDQPDLTVRGLLTSFAPGELASIGTRMLEAERRLMEGDGDAGILYGELIGEWGAMGGYDLESAWEASCRRIVRQTLAECGDRPASTLSGGERKQLVIDLLFASNATTLLLDEPDNYLDIPAKRWLEDLIASSRKTILFISHDRELLTAAANRIVTVESSGAWVHGAGYGTYAQERERRQEQMGDALARWEAEEQRLFKFYKTMKVRAAQNFKNATKANAAETRWKRFVEAGPPPPPVAKQKLHMRLRGGDSARRVLVMESAGIDGLVEPFSHEIHFGERVALIGPNGSGKSHLLGLFAGRGTPTTGSLTWGPRVSAGEFTQINHRTDFLGRSAVEIVGDHLHEEGAAMKALARYAMAHVARNDYSQLSGGQKARLEILYLELEGHNLLLLDEPTDNLDIDATEELEEALDAFEGTVVAVSHDRAFLSRFDTFLLLDHTGATYLIDDPERAIALLMDSEGLSNPKAAKALGC